MMFIANVEIQLLFVHLSCILQPQAHLLDFAQPIMSVMNMTVLLFLSNMNAFYSFFFFCLILLSRTSNTMLNESGKNRHSCLDPDLKESIPSAIIRYDINYKFLIAILYQSEGTAFYSQFADIFFFRNGFGIFFFGLGVC